MLRTIYFKALIIMTVVSLQSCQEKTKKTDSMLFREAAISSAQQPLKTAQALLTQQIKSHPLENLDTLLIIKNALKEGSKVYEKNNIVGYNDSTQLALETYFVDLEPVLVDQAKTLLEEVIDKTVLLRKQIEEAKTVPYSARNTDTSKMVEFLGDAYNKDIRQCCLHSLSQIDQLLASNVKDHRELLILIRSLNSELGKVIRSPNYHLELKRRVEQV